MKNNKGHKTLIRALSDTLDVSEVSANVNFGDMACDKQIKGNFNPPNKEKNIHVTSDGMNEYYNLNVPDNISEA